MTAKLSTISVHNAVGNRLKVIKRKVCCHGFKFTSFGLKKFFLWERQSLNDRNITPIATPIDELRALPNGSDGSTLTGADFSTKEVRDYENHNLSPHPKESATWGDAGQWVTTKQPTI